MQIKYNDSPLEMAITAEGLQHFRDIGYGPDHIRTRRDLRAIDRAIEAVEDLDEALADLWQQNLKATPAEMRALIHHDETQDEAQALTYQIAGILAKLSGCVPEWGHFAGYDHVTVDCPEYSRGTRTKVVYDSTTRSLGLWLFDEDTNDWESGVLGTPTLDLQENYDDGSYSVVSMVQYFWRLVG